MPKHETGVFCLLRPSDNVHFESNKTWCLVGPAWLLASRFQMWAHPQKELKGEAPTESRWRICSSANCARLTGTPICLTHIPPLLIELFCLGHISPFKISPFSVGMSKGTIWLRGLRTKGPKGCGTMDWYILFKQSADCRPQVTIDALLKYFLQYF